MTRFTRRHLIAANAVFATLALLAAWVPAASAQTADAIKKKGTITVGLLVDIPPYGTVDASNNPDGHDADVARLLPGIWASSSMLVASLAVTPERAKQVHFSRPHFAATIVLYGARKSPIKAPAGLKGIRVAVARASTQDTALTAIAPEGTEIRRFDDDASAMQALLSGQVDAIGCSTTVAAQIAKRAGDAYENKLVLKQQFMAVAMRQGQADLLKTMDAFVAKNTANGELGKLYKKWLQSDLPALPSN